jgi:hypothetical protein
MYNMSDKSVTITYGPVPPTNNGSGQFTIIKNGISVVYTYSGLFVTDDGTSGNVNVKFTLSAPGIQTTTYNISANYYNSAVNTAFTPSNIMVNSTFASTPDASLASFTSGSTSGVLNQQTSTSNSLDASTYKLVQQATGTSTILTSGDNTYLSTNWIIYGSPILCEAYVASLVNNGTITNYSTLVNAISIAVAGVYYK